MLKVTLTGFSSCEQYNRFQKQQSVITALSLADICGETKAVMRGESVSASLSQNAPVE